MSRKKIQQRLYLMIIGVTGKACSGKDLVCMLLERYGAHILHVDAIGWEILNEKCLEIRQAFGEGILNELGYIDRQKLGNLVFSKPHYLKILNTITHPHIVEKIRKLLTNYSKNDNVILNAALLPYFNIPELNAVIWVKSHFWKRLFRSFSRDQRGLFFTLKRMWSQRKLSSKLFSQKVDIHVVNNVKSIFLLDRQVSLVAKILGFKSAN